MSGSWKAFAIVLGASFTVIPPCLAQNDPASAAPAVMAPEVKERFLQTAEIVRTRGTSKGVTNPKRVTLSDGAFTHDAQIQGVDIARPLFDVDPKHTEIDFRDSYRYNIAGYRLSLLLGLDNVPMSVERTWNGKPAAITWWIDDAMDETQRQKKKIDGASPQRTVGHLHIMRVFDELIQNRDRNAGNMLWTPDWKLWLIDHTRAFRRGKKLLDEDSLTRCERTLFARIKALTLEDVSRVMDGILKQDEIDALLERRDVIVKHFEARIAERGEAVVLYTQPGGQD